MNIYYIYYLNRIEVQIVSKLSRIGQKKNSIIVIKGGKKG